MRIALITDAWQPQINGVVTTLVATTRELQKAGHDVKVIEARQFPNIPCPTYPEIRLAAPLLGRLRRELDAFEPQAIHIATEGPLGWAARHYCRAEGLAFTTSFHTRFPEYLRARLPLLPLSVGYGQLRRFHRAAARTMVSTPALAEELAGRGFSNLAVWPRGVDTERFRPAPKGHLKGPRPVFMYLGRVAVEKNIEDFLRADLPGSKYVVGDGPARRELQSRYPSVHFTGAKTAEALSAHLAAADCLVFPSRTDTFGLVMMEALACGVPVAAYPVAGPLQVIRHRETGYLDEDLAAAARKAVRLNPLRCRAWAERHSWENATRTFLGLLVSARAQPAWQVMDRLDPHLGRP